MLEYNEITQNKIIILDGEPYEVLTSHVFRKQQRKPVNQTKLKNLITGKVTERSFHQSESAVKADIETRPIDYIYSRGNEIWFNKHGNPKERFVISSDIIGDRSRFLKEKITIDSIVFNEKIIDVRFPIKIDLKVVEAPLAVKGNTAQGANKQITLETGAIITAPMFVNEGDIVRVNTETGEYVERIGKK